MLQRPSSDSGTPNKLVPTQVPKPSPDEVADSKKREASDSSSRQASVKPQGNSAGPAVTGKITPETTPPEAPKASNATQAALTDQKKALKKPLFDIRQIKRIFKEYETTLDNQSTVKKGVSALFNTGRYYWNQEYWKKNPYAKLGLEIAKRKYIKHFTNEIETALKSEHPVKLFIPILKELQQHFLWVEEAELHNKSKYGMGLRLIITFICEMLQTNQVFEKHLQQLQKLLQKKEQEIKKTEGSGYDPNDNLELMEKRKKLMLRLANLGDTACIRSAIQLGYISKDLQTPGENFKPGTPFNPEFSPKVDWYWDLPWIYQPNLIQIWKLRLKEHAFPSSQTEWEEWKLKAGQQAHDSSRIPKRRARSEAPTSESLLDSKAQNATAPAETPPGETPPVERPPNEVLDGQPESGALEQGATNELAEATAPAETPPVETPPADDPSAEHPEADGSTPSSAATDAGAISDDEELDRLSNSEDSPKSDSSKSSNKSRSSTESKRPSPEPGNATGSLSTSARLAKLPTPQPTGKGSGKTDDKKTDPDKLQGKDKQGVDSAEKVAKPKGQPQADAKQGNKQAGKQTTGGDKPASSSSKTAPGKPASSHGTTKQQQEEEAIRQSSPSTRGP